MKLHRFGSCDEVGSTQYALALYTFAEAVQAHDILEIGAGWGWSSRAFALSLENRVGSRLVSVDLFPKRIHACNRAAVKRTGITWDVIDGNSAHVAVPGEFDILYIDGDPHIAHADFLRFYPQVRPGGLVVMDGYNYQVGPTEAVESLSAQYPFTSVPYHAPSSHAVHRKPPARVPGDYATLCETCHVTAHYPRWRDADVAARKHTDRSGHRVIVDARPRDISYAVIAKEDP